MLVFHPLYNRINRKHKNSQTILCLYQIVSWTTRPLKPKPFFVYRQRGSLLFKSIIRNEKKILVTSTAKGCSRVLERASKKDALANVMLENWKLQHFREIADVSCEHVEKGTRLVEVSLPPHFGGCHGWFARRMARSGSRFRMRETLATGKCVRRGTFWNS